MYLSRFVPDKNVVLSAVARLPRGDEGQRAALTQEAFKALATVARENAAYEIHILLSDAIAEYEVVNGRYADLPKGDEGQRARDDYESGCDDVVERVLEPFMAVLSQGWLGTNTIDSRLWEDDGPRRIAESAAKEIWRHFTHSVTPAQALASAGIVASDFDAAMAATTPPVKEPEDMANAIDDVLTRIKQRIGTDYDRLAVYEDLQTIFEEDDEILVGGAVARLGVELADAETLRIAALEFDDAPSAISDKLEAMNAPTKAKPRAPRAPRAAASAAPVDGQLDGGVLEALKACGAGESALAEALGVSRSTFVNYAKGKTPFVPDADQYQTLRKEVVTRANMMLAALAQIDIYDEPMQVV